MAGVAYHKEVQGRMAEDTTMMYDDLTPEQRERICTGQTPEEMLARAQDVGYELSDEELESVAGGSIWDEEHCIKCGYTGRMFKSSTGTSKCPKCGNKWSFVA